MRKSILLAEFYRLAELEEILSAHCPVCRAASKLKDRHEDIACSITLRTACHPTVQKRCSRVLEEVTPVLRTIEKELQAVIYQIIHSYNITYSKLRNHYKEWKTERDKDLSLKRD